MISAAAPPPNESERLAAVRRYSVLDTPPDGSFDRITRLAADIFDVPIALVTIVDEDRIWFKSRRGLDAVTELPRDPGLCASAICQDVPYVVEQARTDPRALSNPLVAGEFGLQFYAGAQLRTHDGHNLGTLCVIDRRPRQFSAKDRALLETLAGVVIDELELRLRALTTVSIERELRRVESARAAEQARLFERERRIAETLQREMMATTFPDAVEFVFSATYAPATTESLIGGDWYDAVSLDDGRFLVSIGDVAGHGIDAAVRMGKIRQSLRTLALQLDSPSAMLQAMESVIGQDADGRMVTAFVGIVEVDKKVLTFASAGHPPPFKRSRGGQIREIIGAGPPLGLKMDAGRADRAISLDSGDLLVLYTDGLTEATRDVVEGERRVVEAIANLVPSRFDRAADDLQHAVLPDGANDDVAILTIAVR